MALDMGGGLFDGVLGGQRRELSVLGWAARQRGVQTWRFFKKNFQSNRHLTLVVWEHISLSSDARFSRENRMDGTIFCTLTLTFFITLPRGWE